MAIFILFSVCLLIPAFFPSRAFAYVPVDSPSVILVEQETGKVLYAKDEHARMYPASLTKMLTALIAVEYLEPDEIVVVGNEIYALPGGSLLAGHRVGESITVHNLLRALMIQSGNDTGNVLAAQVVAKARGRTDIPYSEAERIFCGMMNDKARELGADNTNNVNPNGLHHESHYTTAYDMSLIARAYMDNEFLRSISREREYTGNSLGGLTVEGAVTRDYTWRNTNELVASGSFTYLYATGIKTGSTDQAGHCLAAAAERRDLRLVSIVFYSPDPGRWNDTRMLFDYGFDNFYYETIQTADTVISSVPVINSTRGDSDTLDILTNDSFTTLLSTAEFERIKQTVTYDEQYLAPPEEGLTEENLPTRFAAPIEEGAIVGSVTYTLDDEILFEGTLRAASSVEERTIDTEMDFYIAWVWESVFSMKALPYWLGAAGVLIGIIGVAFAIAEKRRNSRNNWRYTGRRYK